MSPNQFVAIISPSAWVGLKLTPREKWKMKYRSERMLRKGQQPDVLPEMKVGRIEGFSFIFRS